MIVMKKMKKMNLRNIMIIKKNKINHNLIKKNKINLNLIEILINQARNYFRAGACQNRHVKVIFKK